MECADLALSTSSLVRYIPCAFDIVFRIHFFRSLWQTVTALNLDFFS